MRDPYQADEAAAFTLTIQSGRPAADTTIDMFGISGDELPSLLARCASRAGHDATGAAQSDLLTPTLPTYHPTPENAASALLTGRSGDSDV
jgi:hypothetical protein